MKPPDSYTIAIGVGESADLESLVELLTTLFEQEVEFAPNSNNQRRALAMLLDAPDRGLILVARADAQLVGMVSLLFTISTAEGGMACWLEDMVVDPAWRGLGIGTQLVTAALNTARQRGLSRITLLTDSSNVRAQQFYTRHGFEKSTMVPLRLHLTLSDDSR